MSASSDANQNNLKVRLKTLMKNAKGIQRNYKVSFMYLFFYKQKVHIQLGQGGNESCRGFCRKKSWMSQNDYYLM